MARPRTQRDRERERQRARQVAVQQRAISAQRRRRMVAVVAFVLVLAMLAAFLGTRSSTTDTATTTSSPSSSAPGTTIPTTGIPVADLPHPPPGLQITGETSCPAEDGSSPRTTTFSQPPPTCIDPTLTYDAVLSTSVGDMTINLDPTRAPNAVNNFIVLARYHYYDGQPFTTVRSRESASVLGLFENPPDRSSPGYSLAGEAPPQGQIFVPGQIAMIPESEAGEYGGAFLLATFELAAGLPQSVTSFGQMLDGDNVLRELEHSASKSGQPTKVITINAITVTPSIPA